MIKRLTPWVFLLLLLCTPRSALSQTASITGTVKDSTGAAVPQARVTSHNRATSATRNTATDDSGNYRITSLSPGNYDVVIEKAGFKTFDVAGITVASGDRSRVDAQMAVGQTSETVEVSAQAALLQTEQSRIVMTVGPDGKARPKPVQAASWIGTNAVITGGLEEGDKVIVDNLVKLRPGTPVEARPVQPK